MQILNIGPLELIIALLIMFLLLGPKEMILTAQRIGQWIRNFVRSPMWREIWGYSQEIRELPQKLMDDTGLKEALDDVKQTTQQTANELNSTVREAVQEARVPEAENIKIEAASGVLPGAKTARPEPVKAVPAAPVQQEPQTIAPPELGAEMPESATDETEGQPLQEEGAAPAVIAAEPTTAGAAAELPSGGRVTGALPADVVQAAAAATAAAEAAASASAAAASAAAEATAAATAAAEAAAAASAAAEAVTAALAAAKAQALQEKPKSRKSRAQKTLPATPGPESAAEAVAAEPSTLETPEPGANAEEIVTEAVAIAEVSKPKRGRPRKGEKPMIRPHEETSAGQDTPELASAAEQETPEPESAAAAANRSAVELLAAQVRALTEAAKAAAEAEAASTTSTGQASEPAIAAETPKPRRRAKARPVGPASGGEDLPSGNGARPNPAAEVAENPSLEEVASGDDA